MKVHIHTQSQEQEILLSYSMQTHRGIIKKKKKEKKKHKTEKRFDLAALHSLVGKEGWQERKNPEFC